MNNLQDIKNRRYLDRIRENGLRVGDEILIKPFNENHQKICLTRKFYRFSHKRGEQKPWVISISKILEKDFDLELKLLADGQNEEGCYFLISHCKTPFKINGTFCYQSFVERGDEIEFGLHQMVIKNDVTLSEDITIPLPMMKSSLPLLIEGETGTGKTHLVKKIHLLSGRHGNLVHLNLSSFSPSLFESEIFGHVKGAFTGADRDKKGALIEADDGTLFIDEVDSLPRDLQIKLLLFLDNGRVRPVGAQGDIKVRTRLITASGQELSDLIKTGDMRKDFFFRIQSSYKITLRPLRHNPQKIEALCEKFSLEENVSFSSKLIKLYKKCPWPGNIRQFLGHLRAKKILSSGRKLDIDDFDQHLLFTSELEFKAPNGNFLDLASMKINYAKKIFELSGQDINLGAKILKINPGTLRSYVQYAKRLS